MARNTRYRVSKTYRTKCPNCGKIDLFYEDESGSKVFFGELGEPWSEHRFMCPNWKSRRKNLRLKRRKSGQVIDPSILDAMEREYDMPGASVEQIRRAFFRPVKVLCEETA